MPSLLRSPSLLHRIALIPLALTVVLGATNALAAERPADPATFVPDVARNAAAEGSAAFARGDYDTARDAFRKVVELAPGNIVGLVNLGVVEFRAGNPREAEKILKLAVQKRLETGPAWLTLGMIYFEERRLDEALAALAQAVLYDEANSRAHNYFGVVLQAKGWRDGAEAELRRAVELDPEYRDAHYNLALLYQQRRPPSVELAKRHYYRSVELGGPRDGAMEKSFQPPDDPEPEQ